MKHDLRKKRTLGNPLWCFHPFRNAAAIGVALTFPVALYACGQTTEQEQLENMDFTSFYEAYENNGLRDLEFRLPATLDYDDETRDRFEQTIADGMNAYVANKKGKSPEALTDAERLTAYFDYSGEDVDPNAPNLPYVNMRNIPAQLADDPTALANACVTLATEGDETGEAYIRAQVDEDGKVVLPSNRETVTFVDPTTGETFTVPVSASFAPQSSASSGASGNGTGDTGNNTPPPPSSKPSATQSATKPSTTTQKPTTTKPETKRAEKYVFSDTLVLTGNERITMEGEPLSDSYKTKTPSLLHMTTDDGKVFIAKKAPFDEENPNLCQVAVYKMSDGTHGSLYGEYSVVDHDPDGNTHILFYDSSARERNSGKGDLLEGRLGMSGELLYSSTGSSKFYDGGYSMKALDWYDPDITIYGRDNAVIVTLQ
jgi:hypothetical protein